MDFETRFYHHLGVARQKRSIRLKQIFFNARVFYVLPVVLSMTIANTVAHAMFDTKTDMVGWVTIALATTIVLIPFAYRFMRKDMAFDRERYYLLEALKLTLDANQEDGTPEKK